MKKIGRLLTAMITPFDKNGPVRLTIIIQNQLNYQKKPKK